MDCDLSATWKLVARGGATKIKKNPCHLCAITDCELAEPNAVPCERWCRHRNNNSNENKILCYHQDFVDPSSLDDLRLKLQNYKEEINVLIPELNNISNKCLINCNEDPRAISANYQQQDSSSIHFDFTDPTVEEITRESFGDSLTHDLIFRKLSGSGTIAVRVERLKQRLIQEFMYKKIHNDIQYVEQGQEKSFLLMHECVPCILHLENRTGLKLLTLLLQAGLLNLMEERSYTNVCGVVNKMKHFLSDLEYILNKQIFGSEMRPSNFHLPFNFKDKKFDDITMDNNRTRQVMSSCTQIIDLCIVDENRKSQWLQIIDKYNKFMKILRRKEDFSDELISDFQYQVDDFYNIYLEENGRAGITNYFHMLGSGHISDFLIYYRNLYVHSQQGWEAFNSYLKVFFFRRTSRGGGRGDNNRVRQIARWLSRRLIWMSGTNYLDMEENKIQVNDVQNIDDELGDDDNSLDSLLDDNSINYY